MTFDGKDLYPTLVEKAAARAFSLIRNHPFVDGNKRIGHAAMATFLFLNGREVVADVDEQETIVIGVGLPPAPRAGGGPHRPQSGYPVSGGRPARRPPRGPWLTPRPGFSRRLSSGFFVGSLCKK